MSDLRLKELSRRREEFLNQSQAPLTPRLRRARWQAGGWLLGAFAISIGGLLAAPHGPLGGMLGLTGPLALVLCMTSMMRRFTGTGDRYALELSRTGLRDIPRVGRARRFPWSCVERVEVDHDGARVHTTRGVIEVDADVYGWARFAEQVAAVLGQGAEAPSRPPTVTPEQVEAWLGIAPGEVMTVVPKEVATTRRGRTVMAVLAAAFGIGAGVALLAGGSNLAFVFGVVAFQTGVMVPVLMAVATAPIEVSADGIRMRKRWGGLTASWDDVRSVRLQDYGRRGRYWIVDTTHKALAFSDTCPESARLAHAIEQAVEARRAGEVLPRMSEVSDAAISPVSASVSAERGVSRAEGEPEP